MTRTRALRIHVWTYAAAASALSVVNWLAGDFWWSFWPLAGWALILATHYLMHKTSSVDEQWAAERTAEVHGKSYDVSHIDRIAEDQAAKASQLRPK